MEAINSCPLCRSPKLNYLYPTSDRMFELPGRFAIRRCAKCHLWILSPRPSIDNLNKYYPKQNYYAYKAHQSGFFSKLRDYMVRHYYRPSLLSKIISTLVHEVPALPQKLPGGRILDIGCGAGETLLLLRSLGWQVYGLEIDRQAVKVAQKRGLTDVKYGGYRDLAKYSDNYFDAVRLYHVFEHLDDPLLCLRLIARKVKKGGEVIIGTPNSGSFAARLFKRYWYNLDSPRHLFLFNPKLLEKLASQAGLRPRKVEFCSAGGLIGSLQYYLREKNGLRMQLIHQPVLVILFYRSEEHTSELQSPDHLV